MVITPVRTSSDPRQSTREVHTAIAWVAMGASSAEALRTSLTAVRTALLTRSTNAASSGVTASAISAKSQRSHSVTTTIAASDSVLCGQRDESIGAGHDNMLGPVQAGMTADQPDVHRLHRFGLAAVVPVGHVAIAPIEHPVGAIEPSTASQAPSTPRASAMARTGRSNDLLRMQPQYENLPP